MQLSKNHNEINESFYEMKVRESGIVPLVSAVEQLRVGSLLQIEPCV